MKAKSIYAMLAVFFFMAGAVYAAPPQNAVQMVAKMQSKLNLTQDQVNAIKPIIEDTMAKRQELKQTVTDKDAMHTQMQQLKDDENQKIGQILTADQMTQWTAMQGQMHHGPKQ